MRIFEGRNPYVVTNALKLHLEAVNVSYANASMQCSVRGVSVHTDPSPGSDGASECVVQVPQVQVEVQLVWHCLQDPGAHYFYLCDAIGAGGGAGAGAGAAAGGGASAGQSLGRRVLGAGVASSAGWNLVLGGAAKPPGSGVVQRGKLGVCYNVFDGHELLEYSIASVRGEAGYVCVVYQKGEHAGVCGGGVPAPVRWCGVACEHARRVCPTAPHAC